MATNNGTCGTCVFWSSRRTWQYRHGICECPNPLNGRKQTATARGQGCRYHEVKKKGRKQK